MIFSNMFSLITSFVPNIKNFLVMLTGILFVFSLLYIMYLKGIAKERDLVIQEKENEITLKLSEISNLKTELNILVDNVEKQKKTISSLTVSLEEKEASMKWWFNRYKEKEKVLESLSETQSKPLIEKGVVLDEESSKNVINFINSIIIQ